MRRVLAKQKSQSLTDTEVEPEDEMEDVECNKVVTLQKPKGRTVAIPPKTPISKTTQPVQIQKAQRNSIAAPGDVKAGFIYTKAGQKDVYETQAKKYYFVRENGTKSYVTKRITDGRLAIYE